MELPVENAGRPSMQPNESRCRTATWIALFAILLVALAVRVRGLEERCFWLDEAVSWRLIRMNVGEMLGAVARDNHPPLYFLLLKGWSYVFGDSVVALRALSVTFGLLTVGAAYLLVKQIATATPGLKAVADEAALGVALLTALSALQIRWSWDARMYAMGAALAAGSTWSLIHAIGARRATWRWWAAYGLLSLAFLYTHYYAVFTIVGQAVVVGGVLLARARRSRSAILRDPLLLGAASAGILVVAGFAPWAGSFAAQAQQVRQDYWSEPFRLSLVANEWYQAVVGPDQFSMSATSAYAAGSLCAGIFLATSFRATVPVWLAVASGAAPTLLSAALSPLMGSHVFTGRYLVFSHVFLLACVGLLAARVRDPVVRRLLLGLLVVGSLSTYWAYYESLDLPNRPGCRAAARFIVDETTEDDLVIFTQQRVYLAMMYHAGEPGNWRLYVEGGVVPHYMGSAVFTPTEVLDGQAIGPLLASRRRVFVCGSPATIPWGPAWAGTRLARFTDPSFRGDIAIHRYER